MKVQIPGNTGGAITLRPATSTVTLAPKPSPIIGGSSTSPALNQTLTAIKLGSVTTNPAPVVMKGKIIVEQVMNTRLMTNFSSYYVFSQGQNLFPIHTLWSNWLAVLSQFVRHNGLHLSMNKIDFGLPPLWKIGLCIPPINLVQVHKDPQFQNIFPLNNWVYPSNCIETMNMLLQVK